MRAKIHITVLLTLVASVSLLNGQGRGVPGSIAFTSMRDGNQEIYVMNWDGSEPRRLTDNPAVDGEPAISPDGRDIIFTSNRTGNNDIYIMDSDGGPAINLTNDPGNDGWARWSPDGKQVVFHSNRAGGDFEIYVMDADGRGVTRVTDHPGVDQFPDWSPNGKEIVFRRDIDIYTIDLSSGETTRLTSAPVLNQMATYSPNGREIAFMSAREGYPSVFKMNADGSNQVNLTPKGPSDAVSDWLSRAPTWSTNGRQIYFMSFRPSTAGDTELFMINSDGSGLRRLTSVVGVDGTPHVR